MTNSRSYFSLSSAQRDIWIDQVANSDMPLYNIGGYVKIEGQVDAHLFDRAVNLLVEKHDALRLVFEAGVEANGLPAQYFVPSFSVSVPLIDFSLESDARVAAKVWMQKRFVEPYSLYGEPLFRFDLLKIADDEYWWLAQYHHLITDGWSIALLNRSLADIYSTLSVGADPCVIAPSFLDHLSHESCYALSDKFELDRQYWLKQYQSVPLALMQPYYRSQFQGKSATGGCHTLYLRSSIYHRLNTLAGLSKASTFHVMIAALSVYFGRISQREELVIGLPILNRSNVGFRRTAGLFAGISPVTFPVDFDVSIVRFVKSISDVLRRNYRHQRFPVSEINRGAGIVGDAGQSQLFDLSINFAKQSHDVFYGDSSTRSVVLDHNAGQTPLAVSIWEFNECEDVQIDFSYNFEYFKHEDVEAISSRFGFILEQFLDDPEKQLSDISIAMPLEPHQLLTEWNDTEAEYPSESCIHELFEKQVKNSPEATALVFENQQLSYWALNSRANQLAHYLVTEKHVRPDTLVGICLERSLEMVIAILAIVKAGGAYVPLDPNYPEARLAYMLDDADLGTVITNSDVLVNAPISSVQALCLNDPEVQCVISGQSVDNLKLNDLGLNSKHLAYVIYTSGSTGNPKGVMVGHQAIVNRICWMHEEYGASERDVFLQKTPFSFDVSVWEFFWPLMAGAQLLIAKPQGHTDPVYLNWLIQERGVTKLHFVPSMLSAMLSGSSLSECQSLQQVFCSGEALAVNHVRDFYIALPYSELHNLYGPTEAAVDVSYWACPAQASPHSSVPIGRPIHNVQLHVLDKQLQLLPRGVVGELHIGGIGLARGYLNRAELSADKFIQSPFSDDSADRLYKTGDLVRWLTDGNLEYIGRIDDQVKIRGFRIELGEIENTLLTHELITETVVVARGDSGDKCIVAYVVTRDVMTATESAVDAWRQHLGQSLPDHMMPASFVVLDALPLTANGKLDRKALPAPDMSQQQNMYVAPITDTEKVLCEIWQDILKLEQVGVKDNFFRLGGHSLLLIQMLARLQETGRYSDVRSLFGVGTLGELAAQLDSTADESIGAAFTAPRNRIPETSDTITPEMLSLIRIDQAAIDRIASTVPGGAANIQEIYPLAPLQEGILFHHQMSKGGGDPYVMPILLAAKSRRQREEFLTALQVVVDRHDALRTAILWEQLPQAVQVVYRHAELSIETLALNTDVEVIPQLVEQMAPEQQTLDITQAPLLHVQLADDTKSGQYFMLLKLHHLVDDVSSIIMMQSEIKLVLQGKIDELVEPAHYREFVAHTKSQAKTLNAETFFRNKLSSITEPTAPFNLLDVHGSGGEIVEASQYLRSGLSQNIRNLSKQLAVSPAALFHTVFGLVVGVCSGRNDVVFGTVLSGRLQGTSGAQHMLGMFINTLPYRLTLQGLSAESAVLQAQIELQDLLTYEQASLVEAQKCSGVSGGTPLFSALLNYRHSASEDQDGLLDVGVDLVCVHERTNYPFSVSVDDSGEEFYLTAYVNEAINPSRVIGFLQTALDGLVEAIERTPNKALLEIDIVPEQERHQLLAEWNDTQTDYLKNHCIHEKFESQVERNPDGIALVFDEQKLTYIELNRKANQLAHYLVTEKNVRPDMLVGICLERSLDMVIAIMGILKAGGAYVPLDPTYPEARLAYIIEDSDLDTVITVSDVLVRTAIIQTQALCLNSADVKHNISLQLSDNLARDTLGLKPNHLAYVIYTSGSTGNPKGVLVEHDNVVRLFKASERDFQFDEYDVWTLFHSYAFDFSVWELWGPLMYGGRLVVVPHWVTRSPDDFYNLLVTERVTILSQTPSAFSTIVAIDEVKSKPLSLRRIVFGGEKLNSALIIPWISRHGDQSPQLINMYGITETTVHVTYYQLLLDDLKKQGEKSIIGRPLTDLSTWVLRPENQLSPIGVAGELHIGGGGLTRGYLNRPELTAEKFIPNPFSDDPSDRLYKTGDLVRWLSDGNLEYIGRIDDQVKIRGFRIELGEIENTLLAHESITETVVVVREDDGDKWVVAYVVTRDDVSEYESPFDTWLQYLGKSLPDYMLPSSFVVLDALPLTANGKVDRKALPAPDMSQQQNTYVAPTTDTEKVLCEIWQDILNLEKVGVTDNFFRLGGHSLLLIQLLACLQESGRHTDVYSLFSAASLGELAAELDATREQAKNEFKAPENLIPEFSEVITPEMLSLITLEQAAVDNIVATVPGGAANIQDIYPLAPLQEGILFHHQMSEGGGDPYVMPVLLAAKSHRQRDDFLQALQVVVDRHDVFRTAILWEGLPQAVQAVQRSAEFSIEDITLMPDVDVMPQLLEKMVPELQYIDITKAPLLRVQIADDPKSGKFFMLLKLHHLIDDVSSIIMMQSEIKLILQGERHRLIEPVPYREFVAHERHQAKALNAELFFRGKLSNVTEPTAPFNLLDVHGNGGVIVEASQQLRADLSGRIRKLSKQLAVSPAALFHAVFGLVVGVCSGRDDVVFGTVLSGRLQGTSGAKNMLGMFINTLPYRLILQGLSAKSAVLQAQIELQDLLPYEQASLVEAQKCSGVSGGTPLFSALLNYRHSDSGDQDGLLDFGVDLVCVQERTNYPFSVSVDDAGEDFSLTAYVNEEVHPTRIIGFLQTALVGLVEAIERTPHKELMDISIIPELGRHQLLVEWNDTQADYPKDSCIHELFEEQVKLNPDGIALVFDEQNLTYAELNRQANQLAHYLVEEKNVRPDTLVGVCLERSLEMVIAILGIVKAGGAYVPLDPDYPGSRLTYMLDDASLDTVITSSNVFERIPITSVQGLCLNESEVQRKISMQSADNLKSSNLGLRPHHLAYVIYTSGSTGKPKGVMVEHQSIVNRIFWMHEQYGATEQDVFLQKTPFSFDVSVWEFFWPLMAGAQLVIAKPQGHTDPVYLNSLIREKGVTKLHFVPSMLSAMLSGSSLSECQSLQQVFCSGEALVINHVREFYTVLPNSELHNLYGPTEAAVDVSYWACPAQDCSRPSVPIGRPINNIQLHVLDKQSQLLPQGVLGELHIGGVGLARGYLDRAELTAEKFIQNPFSEDPDDRLYKTGDLVRWLPDGNLEYIGRMDDQVKIRGFRIELGEIENTLLTHDLIKEVAVVAREDRGDKILVAYVVADIVVINEESEGESLVSTYIEAWRQHLNQSLPEYMLPSHFVILDSLPLTLNAKIDRKALPAPDMTQQQGVYVAPTTKTEKVLCEIWQEILGLESVGVTDNFFRLGGHSILATRLVSQVNRVLVVELSLKVLFESNTVQALAIAIESLGSNFMHLPIEKVSRSKPLLLSHGQQRLWFIDQVEQGSSHYNMPAALRVSGDLNIAVLQNVFNTLIDRHESLRTIFVDAGDGPRQHICSSSSFRFSTTDLSSMDSITREEKILQISSEESRKNFDLSHGLMLRAQLIKLAEDEHILLVTMHHIASDGWSVSILIKELSQLYQAYVEGNENPLPPLAIQYADYANWQREWLQGEVLDRKIDYWQVQLLNLPVVHNLPLDKIRPQRQTYAGSRVSAELSESSLDSLNALCIQHDATLFMGLHAVFSVLLARYSGETDIVIGSPIANREQAEVENIIGFFVNTLVLRSDVSGSPSFIDLLQQSKRTALDAYAHQQVPFEQLVEVLQPERSLSHSPLFQVMLVLQNNENSTLELPGLTLSSIEQSKIQAKFDLTLNVEDADQGLAFEWEFNTGLFEASTIERMASHFVSLLESFISCPNESVYTLEFLNENERHQLLAEWNDHKVDFPNDNCIHELFEDKVKNSPESIALVFKDQQLTYRELNIKSNQLAHYLVTEKNVRPDTLVGICLERSFDMVIAILGILKAGGAYVPMDPDYPEARLTYIIDDSGLDTVISSSDVLMRTPIISTQALCLNDSDVQDKLSLLPFDNVKSKSLGLRPSHLAYVIYTSGSTGNPKGVLVEHHNVMRLFKASESAFKFDENDVWTLFHSYAFDFSVWELWGALMYGGRLVVVPYGVSRSPDEFYNLLVKENVTILNQTPSAFSSIVSVDESKGQTLSLRYIIFGGEKLNPALIIHWMNRHGDQSPQLINMYGITETTVHVTYRQLLLGDLNNQSDKSVIGHPLSDLSTWVLNSENKLTPIGVAGELHVGGAGLTRGYLNRPELTAEKFIQNPFSEDPSERLYKSGDLVCRLPDGNLEYIGRIDDQVKIRGFRIELGEIENTLLTHELIAETVVIVREDDGDKRIVAYVVTRGDVSDYETPMDVWRQYLGQMLPDYMLPSSFVVLDALPLTVNGKVDRKVLPAPDLSQQQNIYVAPTTDTEKVLCEIWQDILNLEKVGVTDNFFRLGGHSLLLIQLLARLQETGRRGDVHSLFRAASLGELAEQLDAKEGDVASEFKAPDNLVLESSEVITPEMLSLIRLDQASIDSIVSLVPGGAANIQDIYPLVPLQEGILFHHQMGDGVGDTYVMPVLLAAKTRQQRDEFLQALQSVVNRHDVLRSIMLWQGLPQAVQVVCRQVDLSITSLALNMDAEIMPQLLELMEPAKQFMDITQAPLLRVKLAEDPENGQYFVLLQLHHIISDHVGLEIIQAEVQEILEGKANTLTSPAPYREFVAQTLHKSQTLDVEKFFGDKLGSITEPTAPFNLLDVHGSGATVVETRQLLSNSLSQRIRTISRRLSVSPAALFHTVFGLVVGACSGRDDVVFGTVLSGRLQGTAGAGRMLGLFINTLPCRLTLKGIGSEAMVLQAQAELLALLPYEQASLVLAQKCSGLPNGTPLFSALLNYRHSAPEDNDLVKHSGMDVLQMNERSNYPFTVSVDDLDDDFSLTAQVDSAIDPVRVVEYLQAAMENLVEALDSTPDKAVLDINVLPVTERNKLLVEWNNTDTEYPQERCIHELFEEQVNNNPDAIAVVFEDQKLRYRELNEKANQLAHYLVSDKCVQPDTLIGVCLERSLEMVIAIFGILKAGGAYVPLDPDYPEARLAYILKDASMDTVITSCDVLERTPITSAQALCWDGVDVQKNILEQSTENVMSSQSGLKSNHLAYVIYTSGSTGNPKGVMIEHRNSNALIHWGTRAFSSVELSAVLASTSLNFDLSVFEVFLPLASGGCVVLVKDALDLLNEPFDKKITLINTVPSVISTLLFYDAIPSSVKTINLAGELLKQELVDKLYEHTKDCVINDLYGPSEDTTYSTYCRRFPEGFSTIGRPIDNGKAYVLSAGGMLQPTGVEGELYLGGDGLARGYLNRLELTAEKFIKNLFSDDPDDRLYKTGDLVRWLPDGSLEYVGRMDDQVKIRGFRVELGEIESILLKHESVKEVVVVAREDQDGKQLVAYVVAATKGSVDVPEDASFVNEKAGVWRQYLSMTLPEYMLPSSFVVLGELPLTPNGKVDRKAFPDPDVSKLQVAYEAPITDTEKELCKIWQAILGVEQVGVTDNFFSLGGHSLLATKLLVSINKQFDINLNVKDIFSTENVRDLDDVIADHVLKKRERIIEEEITRGEEIVW